MVVAVAAGVVVDVTAEAKITISGVSSAAEVKGAINAGKIGAAGPGAMNLESVVAFEISAVGIFGRAKRTGVTGLLGG